MPCVWFARVLQWAGSRAENVQIFSEPFLGRKSFEELTWPPALCLGGFASQEKQSAAYLDGTGVVLRVGWAFLSLSQEVIW